MWSTAALVVIGIAGVSAWRFLPHQEPKKAPIERQITANPSDTPVRAIDISPDGRNIAYSDRTGLFAREIESGETKPLPLPAGFMVYGILWSPDPTTLFLYAIEPGGKSPALWSFSLLERTPRKVVEEAAPFAISADGGQLLYATSHRETGIPYASAFQELWIAGARGEIPRQLVRSADGEGLLAAVWSPEGRRFALVRLKKRAAGDFTVSLETRNPDGGDVQEILSDTRLVLSIGVGVSSVAWLPGGRLIYALTEPTPNGLCTNLWQVSVDPATGRSTGTPRRVTTWTSGTLLGIESSADGRRLAYLRSAPRVDIHVADLEAKGEGANTFRRFTMDDWGSSGPTWTPDGGSVVFFSQRGDKPGLYVQQVDSTLARAVVLQSEDPNPFRTSPDGKYVLFRSSPSGGGPASLVRVPLAGGVSEIVSAMEGWTGFDCPAIPSASCVSSVAREGKLVFSTFDPIAGSGRPIASLDARNPAESQWDLSPDGSRIAVWDSDRGAVTILILSSGERRTLTTEKLLNFGAFWTSSSDALLVSGWKDGSIVLRMDMEGKTQVLLEATHTFRVGVTPSPDGKRLACMVGSLNSNVWLLENCE